MRTETNIINEKIATLKVALKDYDEQFICLKLEKTFHYIDFIDFTTKHIRGLKLEKALINLGGKNAGYAYVSPNRNSVFSQEYKDFKDEVIKEAIRLLEQERDNLKNKKIN